MIDAKVVQNTYRRAQARPRGYPIIGILPQVIKKPLETLTNTARQSSGVVCLGSYLSGRRVLLITHPEPLKYLLSDRSRSYSLANAFVTDRLRQAIGKGLVLLTNDSWFQRRRILQPAFHRDQYARFAEAITSKTEAVIDQWRTPATRGEPLDMAVEMSMLARDIVAKIMFGFDIPRGNDETNELVGALKIANTTITFLSFSNLMPSWFPMSKERNFQQTIRAFN
jgi:cytochrome P450